MPKFRNSSRLWRLNCSCSLSSVLIISFSYKIAAKVQKLRQNYVSIFHKLKVKVRFVNRKTKNADFISEIGVSGGSYERATYFCLLRPINLIINFPPIHDTNPFVNLVAYLEAY